MGLNPTILRESFDLILERQPEFTPRFYELLFSRYPQAQELFGRRPSEVQQKMLQEALVAVLDHLEDASWLRETLMGMGDKHIEYGVEDHMYPWVGDCLLTTLSEIADEAWTEEVEAQWKLAYDAIAGMMIEGARSGRTFRQSGATIN